MGLWIPFLSLILGFLLQLFSSFPKQKIAAIGKSYLIYLVLPALALLHIPPLKLSWNLAIAPSSAWLTFLISWVVFEYLGRKYHWEKSLTGCLILVAGLANTSFLGFPVVAAAYGTEALATAFLIDQGGSFLIVSTLAVAIGSKYGQGNPTFQSILKKMFLFPPFIFMILGLFLSFFQISIPDNWLIILEGIGTTMAPVALFVIGTSISLDPKWIQTPYLWYGLTYRLLLAPALVWGIYLGTFPSSSLDLKVTVLESGMAPMITGSLIAMEFNLQPRLAALLAGLGIPISGITLLVWYYLLG